MWRRDRGMHITIALHSAAADEIMNTACSWMRPLLQPAPND
jgi:hypothetical protein